MKHSLFFMLLALAGVYKPKVEAPQPATCPVDAQQPNRLLQVRPRLNESSSQAASIPDHPPPTKAAY